MMTAMVDTNKQQSQNPEERMPTYLPGADIVDREGEVKIWTEMPGVANESVNITLDKNLLTVEGEIKSPINPKGYKLRVNGGHSGWVTISIVTTYRPK
jgi:HSP20 family molecular chaperone IbpA